MSNILIVEDHKDFREAVLYFLKVSQVNANLLHASSGEDGVRLARQIKPKIVLMDFWLKGINGIQAATQIKASVPESSIILLTTFDLKDVQPLVHREIIKEYISKSELYDKLLPSINRVLKTVGK